MIVSMLWKENRTASETIFFTSVVLMSFLGINIIIGLISWLFVAGKGFYVSLWTYQSYGWLFVMAAGFIVAVIFWRKTWSSDLRKATLALFIFGLIFHYIAVDTLENLDYKGKEGEIMTNIYAIDEALNKYAEDHGNVYPEDLSVVIKEGYMKQMIVKPPSQLGILTTLDDFPVNPLSYTSEPMRQIEFGDPDFEGNFTYIPVEIDGELKTYYLFCYAPRLT